MCARGRSVDQGEVAVPMLPLDLVDAHGRNPRQILVRSAPGDGHGHRAEHAVPAVRKVGRLAPAQPLRPPRQKPGVGGRQLVLPRRPRHPLDAHSAAGRAGDPAHAIQEEDALRVSNVSVGAAAPAAAAPGPVGAGAGRSQPRAGGWPPPRAAPSGHTRTHDVSESEDSLDLHPAQWSGLPTTIVSGSRRDALRGPRAPVEAAGVVDARAHRALENAARVPQASTRHPHQPNHPRHTPTETELKPVPLTNVCQESKKLCRISHLRSQQ